MLVKLLRFIRGYLDIYVKGVSPERFINLCCNKKIFLWDINYIDGGYEFRVAVKNYKNLKIIAKKTGIVPKIQKKYGLPFILHKHRKRKGFFLGVLVCMVAVYMMSLFIWDISILGGYKYTPELMLKYLAEENIYSGMRKSKVDSRGIEENIRLAYKDIGWVSAEVKGTRLIIKIAETSMPVPAEPAREPSHIVALKDGIITGIVTRTGAPQVKPGDVVKKGDILVSGVLIIYDDFGNMIKKEPVVASATISGKSYYTYENAFSLNYKKKIFTGKTKKGSYITIVGKKIFFYKPSNKFEQYDIIDNNKNVHITDSFYLPFGYGTITTREFNEENRTYSKEEALGIAEQRLQRYINRLVENGVTILENNVTITIEGDYCIAQGRIIVEESAWEYKSVDANEWRMEQIDEYNGDNH